MSLFVIIKNVFQWAVKNPHLAYGAARTAQEVVRGIDQWISSASYAVAKRKVASIKAEDNDRLAEIYFSMKYKFGLS